MKTLSEQLLSFFNVYRNKNPVPTVKKLRGDWLSIFCDVVRKKFFCCGKPLRKRGCPNSILIDDPVGIDEAWLAFRICCYTLELIPGLEKFSTFTGISCDSFYHWMNRETKADSPIFCDTIKKIVLDIEADLLGAAIQDNSRGAMFVLKVKYGYQDRNGGLMFNVINKQDPVVAPDVIEQVEQMIGMENAGKD